MKNWRSVVAEWFTVQLTAFIILIPAFTEIFLQLCNNDVFWMKSNIYPGNINIEVNECSWFFPLILCSEINFFLIDF